MKENEIKRKILSRIDHSVNFTFPEGHKRKGKLTDRVVEIGSKSKSVEGKTYYNVIDLIEFPGREPNIRFGYYIYSKEKGLRWGSQTTLCEPQSLISALLKKGLSKDWFKNIL